MQREILKVNDIDKAIQTVGLEYYVDRLLQDEHGRYHWVEMAKLEGELKPGWTCYTNCHEMGEYVCEEKRCFEGNEYQYRIVYIPKEVAWFCVDALKLQSQVLGIGSSEYDGPHGGKITYVDEDHKEVPEYLVRVEEL